MTTPISESRPTAPQRATVACQFCATLNRVEIARLDQKPKCGECGRPILLDRPLHVSDATFERVTSDSDIPVVVDFYADWCGPCKMMAPILDDLAQERQGELLVVKLNTDENQATAQRLNIRGIPTLAVYRNGREVVRQTGAVPRAELNRLLAEVR